MISFKEVIVKNYKKIGLNEIETMVIVLLYEQKKTNNTLSIQALLELVTLSEYDLSTMIVNLVERGYVELVIEDNMEEHFLLTPTIEKLGEVLEQNDKKPRNFDLELAKVVSYIESLYQKQLAINDFKVIDRWVEEGYTFEQISDAVLESLKAKKTNVKYVDAILVGRKSHEKATNIDPELQEVLQQINVKRR
jgi:DNA replication protein DnaD